MTFSPLSDKKYINRTVGSNYNRNIDLREQLLIFFNHLAGKREQISIGYSKKGINKFRYNLKQNCNIC